MVSRVTEKHAGWTFLTSVGAAASISPQALGAAALTGAGLDNACHDVVRIVGAGPVARRASIRGTPPAVPADARVEADAITTPVVGAAAPNCGESWGCNGSNQGKGEFHDEGLMGCYFVA